MKKTVLALTALMLAILLLAGCKSPLSNSKDGNDDGTPTSTAEPTGNLSAPTEETVRQLADENLKVVKAQNGKLPITYDQNVTNDHYYKVTDERYKSVEDVRKHFSDIYTTDALSEIETKFDGLLVDLQDGLYIDKDKMGGKGYDVNWDNYTVKIGDVMDKTCHVTLTAQKTEPGENTKPEPYNVDVKLKYENGKWRLTKMFY